MNLTTYLPRIRWAVCSCHVCSVGSACFCSSSGRSRCLVNLWDRSWKNPSHIFCSKRAEEYKNKKYILYIIGCFAHATQPSQPLLGSALACHHGLPLDSFSSMHVRNAHVYYCCVGQKSGGQILLLLLYTAGTQEIAEKLRAPVLGTADINKWGPRYAW